MLRKTGKRENLRQAFSLGFTPVSITLTKLTVESLLYSGFYRQIRSYQQFSTWLGLVLPLEIFSF